VARIAEARRAARDEKTQREIEMSGHAGERREGQPAAVITAPPSITGRTPHRSMTRPMIGFSAMEAMKPKENAPAWSRS
jgi:hypothetical protein